MNVIERIGASKIVAIIRLDDLSNAAQLSEALIKGGVNILEFTLTNPDAIRLIAEVREAVGDRGIIGAGSVIMGQQVQAVAENGAQFIVSPIVKKEVIEASHKFEIPIMPGAYTPTEIQQAWEMDVAAVKVFPAGGLGSQYIKDVLAPLPHLRLMPTGGIDKNNIRDFINAGVFAVGIGSSLFRKLDFETGNWSEIEKSARSFCEAIQ